MAVRTRRDAHGRTRFDVEFMQRGRRVLERTPPGTTLAQARERETQLRREAYSVDTLGHAPELLLEEVIQGWLNTKPHKHHRNAVNKANQLLPFVRGRKVSEAVEVAKSAVATWSAQSSPAPVRRPTTATQPTVARDTSGGLALATINRRLAILKAALTHHGREDLSRKIKLRRENNARELYLTRAEVSRLLKSSKSPPITAAISLLAFSGLRPSELLAIQTPSRSDSLTVPASISKNGKARVVPLPQHVRRYVSALPLDMSYDQLYKGFCEARDAAGFGPEVVLYTLRHSYASMLINQGVGLKVVSELMGNSVEVCAKHYAHLYDKTLKDAVRKLR